MEGICGSGGAFAALKKDGTVATWGHKGQEKKKKEKQKQKRKKERKKRERKNNGRKAKKKERGKKDAYIIIMG